MGVCSAAAHLAVECRLDVRVLGRLYHTKCDWAGVQRFDVQSDGVLESGCFGSKQLSVHRMSVSKLVDVLRMHHRWESGVVGRSTGLGRGEMVTLTDKPLSSASMGSISSMLAPAPQIVVLLTDSGQVGSAPESAAMVAVRSCTRAV